MAKTKSGRQVRYLFSKGSPLSPEQKEKLHSELKSGEVKVKGGLKAIGKKGPRKGGKKRRGYKSPFKGRSTGMAGGTMMMRV